MDKSRSRKTKNSKVVVLSPSALSEMGVEYAASHTDNDPVSIPLPLLPQSSADNKNIQIDVVSSSIELNTSITDSSSFLSMNSEPSLGQNSPNMPSSVSSMPTPTTNVRENSSVSTLTPLPLPVTKSTLTPAKSSPGTSGKSKGNSVSFSVPIPSSPSIPHFQFINDDETRTLSTSDEPPHAEGK